MVLNGAKRNLFQEKCELKSPVKLTGLSCPPKSNTVFFNTNTGSRLCDAEHINFKYEEKKAISVIDLAEVNRNDLIEIVGQIKWLDEVRDVLVGAKKTPKTVRDGLLVDKTGAIKISVWSDLVEQISEGKTYKLTSVAIQEYFGIKLTTTSGTVISSEEEAIEIDWSAHNVAPTTVKLCCPDIETVSVNSFLQCINIECRKKVVQFAGELKVSCNACRRKMLIKKCPKNFNIELILSDAEKKQHTVTIFPTVVQKVIDIKDKEDDEIEDLLLMAENIDFVVNKRKVVILMTNHA